MKGAWCPSWFGQIAWSDFGRAAQAKVQGAASGKVKVDRKEVRDAEGEVPSDCVRHPKVSLLEMC